MFSLYTCLDDFRERFYTVRPWPMNIPVEQWVERAQRHRKSNGGRVTKRREWPGVLGVAAAGGTVGQAFLNPSMYHLADLWCSISPPRKQCEISKQAEYIAT